MHSLSPLLVLYASIVFVQMEAPSAALSDDSSEVNVEHVSFTTEDNGVIYADLYGEGDLLAGDVVKDSQPTAPFNFLAFEHYPIPRTLSIPTPSTDLELRYANSHRPIELLRIHHGTAFGHRIDLPNVADAG
jgi:hypothetical protein